MTVDLEKRINEHRTKVFVNSFTAKYHIDRLVYYEEIASLDEARVREIQIKGWRRSKKIALIKSTNPEFTNLFPE